MLRKASEWAVLVYDHTCDYYFLIPMEDLEYVEKIRANEGLVWADIDDSWINVVDIIPYRDRMRMGWHLIADELMPADLGPNPNPRSVRYLVRSLYRD